MKMLSYVSLKFAIRGGLRTLAGRLYVGDFLVPQSRALISDATKGLHVPKEHGVTCWVCHLEETGELHPNFFVATNKDDKDAGHIDMLTDLLVAPDSENHSVDRQDLKDMTYKQTSSSTHLRQHAAKHHSIYFKALQAMQSGNGESNKTPGSSKTRQVTMVNGAYKSVKRLKTYHSRQLLFNKLLTLVVVFLRWNFSIVDNAWFRALVWFLDETVSTPFRKVWQSQHLTSAVEQAGR